MRTAGWRAWYDDGLVYDSNRHKWEDLPNEGLLVKMIYYDDGTKQIQTADWYIEAPHPKGIIRRTCRDEQETEMRKKYPAGVFKKGDWTVDEWQSEVVDLAMATTWETK